ncbi:hypothetical protein [Salibacterium halotolerans]|uniref:hypothetical protein n=1 Tax=Salibacterium halotolerans TaxID=1884432 RepID=UPI000B8A4EA0|nr:hypothetical protein [Salibacterium halotolerans]
MDWDTVLEHYVLPFGFLVNRGQLGMAPTFRIPTRAEGDWMEALPAKSPQLPVKTAALPATRVLNREYLHDSIADTPIPIHSSNGTNISEQSSEEDSGTFVGKWFG